MEPDGRSSATYRVITEHAGQRLDNFLLGLLKGVPRARIYSMLRKGEVRVNGGRCRPSRRLAAGDVVRIPPVRIPRRNDGPRSPAGGPGTAFRARLEDTVLFEDEHLVVLNKPAGVAVHGGSGVSLGVIEALRSARSGTFELIHRLDRDTSGCLAIAKDRPTLLHHHAAFRDGRVKKRYDLVVHGRWPRRLRSVRTPLARYVLPNGERRVRPAAAGMRSRTDFERVDACDGATWLRAFPQTGRTHQIRVHAASAGHPILGDQKYADRGAAVPGVNRLMLHASSLTLVVGEERRRFEAPLDVSFRQVWEMVTASAAPNPVP
ncbi:MAG: RluA family pseudouridine synthase [Gammaproteobacteria bacterium]|nr:RluA family pseudouridine synthase [Gammaproteobacteria bacterium]